MSESSPRGTYLEVANDLRKRIESREFPGNRLPSQAKLIDHYDVSRSTVERALADLRAKGLVESVQGAGWYVAGTADRRPLVEKLTELLHNEELTVGDRFPTEKALCERFQASRTAVHSAIAQLEGPLSPMARFMGTST